MRLDAQTPTSVTGTQELPLERATAPDAKSTATFSAVLRSVQGEQQADLQDRFAPRTNLRELDTLATLGSGLGGKLLEKDPTLVERLQGGYEEKLSAFNSLLGTLFQEEGLTKPEDAKFRLSAGGALQVIGEHPQRAKIQQLIHDNPILADVYAEVNMAAKTVETIKAQASAEGVAPRFSVLFDGLRTQMEFERKAISGGEPASRTDLKA